MTVAPCMRPHHDQGFTLMCLSWLPQERDDEELLALAAMSDDESAGEAGPADGDNANDATDDAAKGTATTAPQPAGAAVAVDEPAQAARSEQCTTPASGSQDSAQVGGLYRPWVGSQAASDA
jgi:hypothetical protein